MLFLHLFSTFALVLAFIFTFIFAVFFDVCCCFFISFFRYKGERAHKKKKFSSKATPKMKKRMQPMQIPAKFFFSLL